jgi:hypothetical protein
MKRKGLRLEDPAIYEIRVHGSLELKWSDRLQGLGIRVKENSDRMMVTILSGRLKDQAALLGVLNTLFTLKLPVLFVFCHKYG